MSALNGLSDYTEGFNKPKTVTITPSVFVKANTTSSMFRRCRQAYMSTNPNDEDLKSLFEIGHFNILFPKGKSRLTAEMVRHRLNFVQGVVRRGGPAVESFERARKNDMEVCCQSCGCMNEYCCIMFDFLLLNGVICVCAWVDESPTPHIHLSLTCLLTTCH